MERQLRLGVLLCLAAGSAALARSGDHEAIYETPKPAVQAPAPVGRDMPRIRPVRRAPAYGAPVYNVPKAVAAAPAVPPRFFVAVVGDNLASSIADGLKEALADHPDIAIQRDVQASSGLVRSDFFDWEKGVNDLLAAPGRIDIAIVLIGSNDAQAIHDGTNVDEVRSDAWKAIYVKRVDAIATRFRDRHIPLVWIGVPVMKTDKLSADLAYINDIYKAEAEKLGATYVDSWEGFTNDQNQFDAYGPDIAGQRARLRTGDGVHFTKAGERKLALFAERPIRQAFDKATPPVDAAAIAKGADSDANALPPEPTVDINALIRREAGHPAASADIKGQAGPSAPELLRAAIAPPALPEKPVLIERPAAGPVLPLTVEPTSADGALVARGAVASQGEAALQARLLAEGRPQDAKPGRADDFVWPRN